METLTPPVNPSTSTLMVRRVDDVTGASGVLTGTASSTTETSVIEHGYAPGNQQCTICKRNLDSVRFCVC
jgi:hypothetical protein